MRLPVQHTDAGWTVDLVTRKSIEVAIQPGHIHCKVGYRLSAVDHHRHITLMRETYDLLDRIYRAERIRYVSYRDKFCAFVQQACELIHNEFPVVVDRSDLQPRTLLFTKQLPGHDVRVMFHRGDQDLVAGFDVGATVAACDEIDCFGGSACKDYLAELFCIDKPLNFGPRFLIFSRRSLAQVMDAAVNVGVLVRIIISQG